jgi:thiosulfate dehydrogenase (quinone) large subunit
MVAIQHPSTHRGQTPTPRTGHAGALSYVLAAARIALGWVFLWAFLDKLFGLGHETAAAKSWLNGGSPTKGFLSHATGPFAGIYHSMAGNGVWDWLFMIGLAGIGITLILGIGMRIATIAGVLLLVLMWSAALPPANNPFMDDHLIYALTLIALYLTKAGNAIGLGIAWTRSTLVRRFPWLA